jgi:hypothetical protein
MRPSRAACVFLPLLIVLGFGACAQPAIQIPSLPESEPENAQPGDRRVLAGEWEYEDGAVIVLTLDEDGNGPYPWKEGRFETRMLSGRIWQGVWIQKENDREGGFAVELSPDLSEGNGKWWYTRIGDEPATDQKGGSFRLTRRTSAATLSQTPSGP